MDVASYILADGDGVPYWLIAILIALCVILAFMLLSILADNQNQKFRERLNEKLNKLEEAEPASRIHYVDELILITRQEDHRLLMRWTWNHSLANGLSLCRSPIGLDLRPMELLGYRKKGGGFAQDPMSDRDNGEQIVHSRQDEALEETLQSSTEFFYTFVLREVVAPELKQKQQPKMRLVARFRVNWSGQKAAVKDRNDTKRERHRRTIEDAVRAVGNIAGIKSLRRKLINEAQASAEFAGCTLQEQQQWLEDIDAIIEETQIKLSNLSD